MNWHQRVQRLLDSSDSDSWDIEVNEELRLAWREEVEGNFCQIYKDLLAMEKELTTLRKYKENTRVYVHLADSIEAVFRARGWERGGLIR